LYPCKPTNQDKEQRYRRLIDFIKKLNFTIPFTNAIDMLLENSKLLKDLITKKVSLKDYGAMTFEEDCSVILENPKKLGYPNSYTTPISIGSLSVGRAFPDLGSSINLISLSLLNKIGKVAMNQHA